MVNKLYFIFLNNSAIVKVDCGSAYVSVTDIGLSKGDGYIDFSDI